MKRNLELAVFVFCLGLAWAGGIEIGIDMQKAKVKQPQHAVIIWNDDEESIPEDVSTIKIEKTVNDTIYIGNVE
jgi:hypothetical protein